MPRIITFGKLAVYVYASPREHPPPHFHVVGPDTDVSIEIRTLRVMEGQYRPGEIADILDWARRNTALLLMKWTEFNERD
jgi:hypothetical protein